MRSRLSFLLCFTATALLLAACSSTTVVARDERATGATATVDGIEPQRVAEDDAVPDDEAAADTDSPADANEDGSDQGDDDRGTREVDFDDGFGLGGAEQITSLLVDCQDGNDLACDILYQISAFDSEEEAAAETCGGRSDAVVLFCTSGIDAGEEENVFDPDSEGLDQVVEACEVDGNMTACDFLYYRSPLNSEFQEIGNTCGGRVNVALPDCRSIVDE